MSVIIDKPVYTLPNGMILVKHKDYLGEGLWVQVGSSDFILVDKPSEKGTVEIAQITFKEENFGQSEYIRRLIIAGLKDQADRVFPTLKHNQIIRRSEIVGLSSGKIIAVFDIMEIKRSGYRGNKPDLGDGILHQGKDADKFIDLYQTSLDRYHQVDLNHTTDASVAKDVFPPEVFYNILRITPCIYYGNINNHLVCAFPARYTTSEGLTGYRFVKDEGGLKYHLELV